MIYDILPVNNYKGNNSTTTFYFDFYIENEQQLKVTLFDNNNNMHELKLNVDYSINEIKNSNGGFINFPLNGSDFGILKEDENISLELILPISQEIKYNNSSLLNLETLEYSLDYLTRLIQIISRKLSLCVQTTECSEITPKELINQIYSKTKEIEKYSKNIDTALKKIEENIVLENSIKDYIEEHSNEFNKIPILENDLNNSNSNIENIQNELLNKTDKSMADGQWIGKMLDIISVINLGNYTLSLASYLPKDNYNYEVLLQIFLYSNSGSYTDVNIGSDIIQKFRIGGCSGSENYCYETIALPVSASRRVYYDIYGMTPLQTIVSVYGYRRLGTNQ